MVATVRWEKSEISIASFAAIAEAALRFKGANNNVNDNNDPLIRPTSGINYSFEKALRFYIISAGGSTSLNSLRVKLSTNDIGATPGPTGSVAQAYNFVAAGSYTQPQQYSGGTGGVGGPMPGREGVLTTTELSWTGADASITIGAGNKTWDNSELLYCQLEIQPGNGGTISTWQTIAVYNEI